MRHLTFKHIDDVDIEFDCKLEISMDDVKANPQLFCKNLGHDGGEDEFLKRLVISSVTKEDLIDFVDKAKESITKKT